MTAAQAYIIDALRQDETADRACRPGEYAGARRPALRIYGLQAANDTGDEVQRCTPHGVARSVEELRRAERRLDEWTARAEVALVPRLLEHAQQRAGSPAPRPGPRAAPSARQLATAGRPRSSAQRV